MPRQRTQAAAPVTIVAEEVVEQDLKAHDEQTGRLRLVDAEYGSVAPYSRDRIEHEIRWHLALSAESMLEAGRRLILLREHEPHGEFLNSLERVGVAPRMAQKLMQAAQKFGERPELAQVGKSKLLELTVLDDEQINLLAEGGTVLGVLLDDVDRMTVSELRAKLREERKAAEEAEAVANKLLAAKNERLDELDRELARRDRLPQDDVAGEFCTRLWEAAGAFLGPQQELRAIFSAIDQHSASGGETSLYQTQCNVLVWLMWRLEEIRQAYHLVDVDLQSVVKAPWEQAGDGTDSSNGDWPLPGRDFIGPAKG